MPTLISKLKILATTKLITQPCLTLTLFCMHELSCGGMQWLIIKGSNGGLLQFPCCLPANAICYSLRVDVECCARVNERLVGLVNLYSEPLYRSIGTMRFRSKCSLLGFS